LFKTDDKPVQLQGVRWDLNRGLRFPEYDVFYSLRPMEVQLITEEDEKRAVAYAMAARNSVLYFKEGLRTLGFPNNPDNFGFRFDALRGEAIYGFLPFEDYFKFHKNSGTGGEFEAFANFNATPLTPFALASASLRAPVLSRYYLTTDFSARTYRGERMSSLFTEVSISKALKAFELMQQEYSHLLTKRDIEATIENILIFWTLNYATVSIFSGRMFWRDEVSLVRERIFSLMENKIPTLTAITALSRHGNRDFDETRKFSYSAEDLAEFNGLPHAFADRFMTG